MARRKLGPQPPVRAEVLPEAPPNEERFVVTAPAEVLSETPADVVTLEAEEVKRPEPDHVIVDPFFAAIAPYQNKFGIVAKAGLPIVAARVVEVLSEQASHETQYDLLGAAVRLKDIIRTAEASLALITERAIGQYPGKMLQILGGVEVLVHGTKKVWDYHGDLELEKMKAEAEALSAKIKERMSFLQHIKTEQAEIGTGIISKPATVAANPQAIFITFPEKFEQNAEGQAVKEAV